MKIRAKIGLSIAASIALALGGAGVTAYFLQKQQIRAAFEDQQKWQSLTWASVCREAALSGTDVSLLNYLRVARKVEGVLFVYLAGPAGDMAVHTEPQWILRPEKEWLVSQDLSDALVLEKTLGTPEEMNKHSGLASRAVIGFSKKHMARTLRQAAGRALAQALAVGLAAMLLGALLAWTASAFLTRQVRVLSRGSEEIGAGRFSFRVPVLSSDELGELASRFNLMAKKLGDLDELKNTLIAMVSHDLRGPLSSIKMGMSYLLAAEGRISLSKDQKKTVLVAQDSAHHLEVFVDNILDHAKIKSGMLRVNSSPCSLADIISAAARPFEISAELRNIRLAVSLPPHFPRVLADPQKLEQAVGNLISNAFKHTPDKGMISIEAAAEKKQARVSISDTGKGIPPEQLEKIFNKFEQLEEAGQTMVRIKGSGLGLFIVRQMIEAQGGRVWAESSAGKGATFRFTVPLS